MRYLILVLLLTFVVYGRNLSFWISPSGNDTDSCGTIENRCNTISYTLQIALREEASGNVSIYLAPGTYSGEKNVNITIPYSEKTEKFLFIGETEEPMDVIIDGQYQSPIIFDLYTHTEFFGITFMKGKRGEDGAGCLSSTHPVNLIVDSCMFYSCSSEGPGGGVYISREYNSSLIRFLSTSFALNRAEYGGGVFVSVFKEPGAIFEHCSFDNNHALLGGALYANFFVVMDSSTIFQNNATYGGAMYLEQTSGVVFDTKIQLNVANYGAGIFVNHVGEFLIVNSFLQAVYGGGLFVQGPQESGGSLTLENSNIQLNIATQGAGVYVTNMEPSMYNGTLEEPSFLIFYSNISDNVLVGVNTLGSGFYCIKSFAALTGSIVKQNTHVDVSTPSFDNNLYCDNSSFHLGSCQQCCSVFTCQECKKFGGCLIDNTGNEICLGISSYQCPCIPPNWSTQIGTVVALLGIVVLIIAFTFGIVLYIIKFRRIPYKTV
eukprot:TRINITY_DN1886_c0_g1_i2.p1 TRINITY_DN1886_c0_g1~~TRINITY_DN1886_c0_g1_i2.p1  ORF type:complete len:490 (+),score=49.04 TRINITY_DN1886_c0_g1_i2:65-1534(+)